MLQTFYYNNIFNLENGAHLNKLKIAYNTYGKLNADKTNVIWVCHALTANSNVLEWWAGLFGENNLYNPNNYFIICANNIGSCYGSTGPLAINAETNKPYFNGFPLLTIKDIANAFNLLRLHLGLTEINTLVGGSQGGQIALEWALAQNTVFNNLILLATNAQHSPWGIAFNESQRLAIFADATYKTNTANAAQSGLAAARSIALLSYRHYNTYANAQQEKTNNKSADFLAASYQRYQGQKLVARFNAYSYVTLLNAMDSHNIARNNGNTTKNILKQIKAKTLVIGIATDILFPLSEQQFLADNINNAQLVIITSIYGHDGFLIETKQITNAIVNFYSNKGSLNKKYISV